MPKVCYVAFFYKKWVLYSKWLHKTYFMQFVFWEFLDRGVAKGLLL